MQMRLVARADLQGRRVDLGEPLAANQPGSPPGCGCAPEQRAAVGVAGGATTRDADGSSGMGFLEIPVGMG
jgi:hypothetical protein